MFACSILASLVTLEIASRCFHCSPPVLTEFHDCIGIRYLPSLTTEIFDEESQRVIHFRASQLGFRGATPVQPKPPGVRRIAVLGDSYVAGHSVDETKCLTGQLQELLQRQFPQTAYEVLNFGVTGSCTSQELVIYEQVIRSLEPDLLVVVFTGDDAIDSSPELSNKPLMRFRENDSGGLELVPFAAARAATSRFLNSSSQLYAWQKVKINHLAKNARSILQDWQIVGASPVEKLHTVYLNPEPPAVARAWSLTAKLLERFKRSTRDAGIDLKVVYLPSAEELTTQFAEQLRAQVPNSLEIDLSQPERHVLQICEDLDIDCCSISPYIHAEMDKGYQLDKWYYGGCGHLNETGHAQVAEFLQSQLVPRIAAGTKVSSLQ